MCANLVIRRSFLWLQKLAPTLIAGVAQGMIKAGLGTEPAGVGDWVEYVKSQMYQPKVYGRALSVKVAPVPVPEVHHEEMQELVMLRQMYTDIQRYLFLRHLQVSKRFVGLSVVPKPSCVRLEHWKVHLHLRLVIQDNNPKVFWKLIIENAQELLPYVYTPTVGEACEKYSRLPIKTRGLYLTQADSGKILEKLKEWRNQDIQVIVVTDGERILGLGGTQRERVVENQTS